MSWIVAYEPDAGAVSRSEWREQRHPSRVDALTACDSILSNGGEVASVIERLDDGSVLTTMSHGDVLRALDIRAE